MTTILADTTARLDLSIVIPAYNEENRLPATLDRVLEYMSDSQYRYEMIVVDDGSRDGTCQLVREYCGSHPQVRLQFCADTEGKPVNRGKGYAVRLGMLAAAGEIVLFSDADLSTPIEEMEQLLPPIKSGEYDVTFASRALPDSKLAVHQPWYREWMGRTFNRFVQRIVHTKIVDTQCGFKAFSAEAARKIFGAALIDGFGFDTELVFLAHKFGYTIKEIPVTWQHRDDSRVSPLVAPFQMMRELLQVRLNDRRGLYK